MSNQETFTNPSTIDLLKGNSKHMTKFITTLKNKLLSEIEETNNNYLKFKNS
jgi:hypothetical protein